MLLVFLCCKLVPSYYSLFRYIQLTFLQTSDWSWRPGGCCPAIGRHCPLIGICRHPTERGVLWRQWFVTKNNQNHVLSIYSISSQVKNYLQEHLESLHNTEFAILLARCWVGPFGTKSFTKENIPHLMFLIGSYNKLMPL